MFKIIKVNLKNNHNLKVCIHNTNIFKVKVVNDHKVNSNQKELYRANRVHTFKVNTINKHEVKTSINVATGINKINTTHENAEKKFRICINQNQNELLYPKTFKVNISPHKIKAEIEYDLWGDTHILKVVVVVKRKIKIEISNVIIDKNNISISNISKLNGKITSSFLIGNKVKDNMFYRSSLAMIPLKFQELQIHSSSRYLSEFNVVCIEFISGIINDLARYFNRLNIIANYLNIVVADVQKYTSYVDAGLYVQIKDWEDVTYAFNTWGEVLDKNERWRDLLIGIPLNTWGDVKNIYDTWDYVYNYYDRWIDLIVGADRMVSINDTYKYTNSIKNIITSTYNGLKSAYLYKTHINEGMAYAIDGYEFYSYRELLNVIVRMVKVKTWEDVSLRYDHWNNILSAYDMWRDLIGEDMIDKIMISSNSSYSVYLLRYILGLIENINLSNPLANDIKESVVIRARATSNYSMNSNMLVALGMNVYIEDCVYRYGNLDTSLLLAIRNKISSEYMFNDVMRIISSIYTRFRSTYIYSDYIAEDMEVYAKINNNSCMDSSMNIGVVHNPIISWSDLLDRATTWENVKNRYTTWKEISSYATTHRVDAIGNYKYSTRNIALDVYSYMSFLNGSTLISGMLDSFEYYMGFNNNNISDSSLHNSYAINGSSMTRHRYVSTLDISVKTIIRPTWQIIIERYTSWEVVMYSTQTWQDVYTIEIN